LPNPVDVYSWNLCASSYITNYITLYATCLQVKQFCSKPTQSEELML
jgi:hypothetical protein